MNDAKNEADSGASRSDAGLGANQNNCETCRHKQYHDMGGGHCYMFRDEPTSVCFSHIGRHPTSLAEQIARVKQLYESVPEWAKPVPNAKVSEGER